MLFLSNVTLRLTLRRRSLARKGGATVQVINLDLGMRALPCIIIECLALAYMRFEQDLRPQGPVHLSPSRSTHCAYLFTLLVVCLCLFDPSPPAHQATASYSPHYGDDTGSRCESDSTPASLEMALLSVLMTGCFAGIGPVIASLLVRQRHCWHVLATTRDTASILGEAFTVGLTVQY